MADGSQKITPAQDARGANDAIFDALDGSRPNMKVAFTAIERLLNQASIKQHTQETSDVPPIIQVDGDTLRIENITPDNASFLNTLIEGTMCGNIAPVGISINLSKVDKKAFAGAIDASVSDISDNSEFHKAFNKKYIEEATPALMEQLTGYSKQTSSGKYEWKLDKSDNTDNPQENKPKNTYIELSEHSALGLKTALGAQFGIATKITDAENQPQHLPHGVRKLRVTIEPNSIDTETFARMNEAAKDQSPFSDFKNTLRNAIAKETSAHRSR